jgi:hypothetical protein
MRFYKTVFVVVAPVLLCPMMSFAQPAAKPDPADATVSVPTTRYDSAFSGYQAYQEQQPGAWREHNDAVGQAGGHAGHRKDAAEKSRPEPSAPAPSMPKGTPDHGGHK